MAVLKRFSEKEANYHCLSQGLAPVMLVQRDCSAFRYR